MPEMKKDKTRSVSIEVRSKDKGALSGAIVQVIGTTQGTVTDTDGHAEIAVPGGSKLMISYPGYEPATVDTKQHSQKRRPASSCCSELKTRPQARQTKERQPPKNRSP
ncbi:MAG: carboxypeptidase-like regulatory domain-containing protein [Alistipes onderdonkii]